MHKNTKLFVLLLVIVLPSFAQNNNNKIEIISKSMHTTKSIVHAAEGVVVYYNNAIIKSDKATFNKDTKLLILDGNVEMVGYKGTKEHAEHIEINTKSKEVHFKKLFMASDNDVWLLSSQGKKSNGEYTLGKSILSSCAVDDPLWHMTFSDSIYDSEDNYMKIYHAKMYFLDVPIFYTPFLAFSTHKERSSGLLFPALGYTPTEGMLYEQPIFWAISEGMDLEFNPQLRMKRSVGGYSTFRFVDSNHSSGQLRVGYFKDKASFLEEFKPEDDSHYGFEFNYESSKVFKDYLPAGYKDELYVNTTFLNDIDYINLQKTRLGHFGLRALQESRVNYFAYDNDNYFGINAKYFIDTRKKENDTTLQILPSIQWHKYLEHFLLDELTYSVDAHLNNITRRKGATLKQAEIRIPIEYTTSFFDDFINLSFSEEFYYSKYLFGNDNFLQDDFQYYSNTHKAKIFTDLIKQYDDFMHVILPSISYVKPGKEKQSPIQFDDLETEQKKLFAVGLNEEQVDFSLSQYFYDDKANIKFFQRISQKYYPNREYKLDDLNNEMGYFWEKWKFYNQIVYSNEFSAMRAISSDISLSEANYKFRMTHTYTQNLTEDKNTVRNNNIDFTFGYTYNEKISIAGGIIYDIENSASKQWKIGAGYHRDCWSVEASLRRDIRPTSTKAEDLTTFYLQLNFIPFGSIGTDTISDTQPIR